MDIDGRRSSEMAKVFDGKMCDVGQHHRLRPTVPAFLLAFGSTRALTRAGKENEAMPSQKGEESRDRHRPLKVFVSERDRAASKRAPPPPGCPYPLISKSRAWISAELDPGPEGPSRPSQGERRSRRAWRFVQALAVRGKHAVSGDRGNPEAAHRS